MPPPIDKTNPTSKYQVEVCEGKQNFFSFRWLLHKSKSSKFACEASAVEKHSSPNVPGSKSCDTGLTTLEVVDRCPTFLLWKLLPPPGKSLGSSKNSSSRQTRPFRSSFSCNDVPNLVSATNSISASESTKDLHVTNQCQKAILKQVSQSCYKLYKSSTALSISNVCSKSPSRLNLENLSANSSRSSLCKLCLVMVPNSKMYYLQDCDCAFCVVCLHQYLTISIKEGIVPITCPDASCFSSGHILLSEIKEIAGDDALFMFERYKLNLDVDLDPTRVWCPSPGCETICKISPPTSPDKGVHVHCQRCRLNFCSFCKLRWHGKASCGTARKEFADEIDLSISEDESWIKRCPNCRIPIEKDDGCAQMMCYRCKHVFCWHCLASLDDDFLLRHYDKGPCRNKLGHSRASMIWHRTQVVGIFAGFSFLLLMASPFLLLAAPCILCCRCKNKLLYEEGTSL